jgi:hypothetical protein
MPGDKRVKKPSTKATEAAESGAEISCEEEVEEGKANKERKANLRWTDERKLIFLREVRIYHKKMPI